MISFPVSTARIRALSASACRSALIAGILLPAVVAAADNFAGTYTVQGAKGPVTLTLQPDIAGSVAGSLQGAEVPLMLRGVAQKNAGVMGTATTEQGKMVGFFRVSRQGNQLLLQFLNTAGTSPGAGPGFGQFLFPIEANGAPAKPSGTAAEPAKSAAPAEPAKSAPREPALANANPGGAAPSRSLRSQSRPAPGAAPAFEGLFKGDELTIESKAVASGYTGLIMLGSQVFAFSGKVESDTLRGAFETADAKFDFTATVRDSVMTFETGGTTYRLAAEMPAKAQPQNPLARQAGANRREPAVATNLAPAVPEKPAEPSPEPPRNARSDSNWKTFQHATGFVMRYPPEWTVNQTPSGLQLVPADAASNAAGPTEAYLVLAEGAPGIATAADPRVVQYLDLQIARLMPFLRRTRQPQPIAAGTTPGSLLVWEGTNPMGMAVQANMFATILKGHAVALLALGDRNQIAKRDAVVRQMFGSFAAGAGEKDPQLAGTWQYWGYKSTADGKYGTTTNRRMVIQSDGTCYSQTATESSGVFSQNNSRGETQWTAGLAGQGNSGVSRGEWSAGRGELFILWADGTSSRWNYQVGGAPGNRRLVLKAGDEKPEEWAESR